MSNQIALPVVDPTGKTRLRAVLEKAKRGEGPPCVGQWLEFPGYTLARTVAPLGADVCEKTPSTRDAYCGREHFCLKLKS
jgi:hypothetical protein